MAQWHKTPLIQYLKAHVHWQCLYMIMPSISRCDIAFLISLGFATQMGGRKPTYITSANIRINIRISAFSVVPCGGRKQMSAGKIPMLDELVSTHWTKIISIYVVPPKVAKASTMMTVTCRCRWHYPGYYRAKLRQCKYSFVGWGLKSHHWHWG